MKRQRTSTGSLKRTDTLPTADGSKHLSKTEKQDVKQIILKNTPKQIMHNGAIPGPPVTGVVNPLPNAICSFSDTNSGLTEYQRRGDQIWIDKIRFRCYARTTASNDALRLTVLRQSKSGFPPLPILGTSVWQNWTAGPGGVVSAFQDDQPCTVLFDKVYTLGIAAGLQECRYIEFTLDYSKRPLKVVYLDNTAIGTANNTVMGDIELFGSSVSNPGAITLTYTFDVTFHEK